MDMQHIKNILEASLLVAGRAMTVAQLEALFEADIDRPERQELRDALASLQQDYEGRGIELVEVASGFRLQSRATMEHWLARLFQEKSPRYSRALLETLVLIAYRQPITRGEIEEVRGVAVSSNIIKTLQEREWVKVLGHKEVPGRPALLGTSKKFLDYFNLKRLEDLPPLSEIKDIDLIDPELAEEAAVVATGLQGEAANESESSDVVHASAEEQASSDVVPASAEEQASSEVVRASAEEQANSEVVPASAEEQANSEVVLASAEEQASSEVVHASAEERANSEVVLASAEEQASSELVFASAEEQASSEAVHTSADEPESHEVVLTPAEALAEPLSTDPQSKLKRVIADFARDHQREVDIQLELESRDLSRPLRSSEAANNDAANDESAQLSEADTDTDEPISGRHTSDDLPKPGDTLH